MNDLEPLDPKLRELLSREQEAYAEDAIARDAVFRRVQAAIVLAPLAVSAVTTVTAKAAGASMVTTAKAASTKAGIAASLGGKGAALAAVVAFGGGVVVGEVHHSMSYREPPPAVTPSTIAQAPTMPTPSPSLSAPAFTPNDLPSVDPSASPVAPLSPKAIASPRSTAGQPSEERAIIDTARTALARRRSADALAAVDEHAKHFPRGRLAEEREALAIQALALAGDREGVLAKAATFRRTYPNSIFGSAVDRATSPFEGDVP